MNHRAKRIVVSASYGLGNLGDEAICETIVRDIFSINQNSLITILVFNRETFFKSHPSFWENGQISVESMKFEKRSFIRMGEIFSILRGIWAICRTDLYVWGGGGLIRNRPDWLSTYLIPLKMARRVGKQVLVWSIGVDRISNQKVIALLRNLEKVRYLSVRDEESKKNILQANPNLNDADVAVVRDPVFHFKDHVGHTKNASTERSLGLNLSFWKADFSDQGRMERFVSSLADALLRAYEKNSFSIQCLPTTGRKDDLAVTFFEKALRSRIPFERVDTMFPEEYYRVLSGVDVFLGMRLHSLILASNIEHLFWMGVVYDEKVGSLKREAELDMIWTIDEIINNSSVIDRAVTNAFVRPHEVPHGIESFYQSSKSIHNILRSMLT